MVTKLYHGTLCIVYSIGAAATCTRETNKLGIGTYKSIFAEDIRCSTALPE